MLDVRVLVDWDRDGFVCRDATLGDAPNIVEYPLTQHLVHADVFLDTDTVTALTNHQVDEPFSLGRLLVDTTGAGTDNCGVGWGAYSDGSHIFDAETGWAADSSTQYTVKFWVRAESTFTALALKIYDDVGIRINTTISPPNDGEWYSYSYTFTTSSSPVTALAASLVNNTASERPIFSVGNILIVEAATAPSGFNTGDATNGYDDISLYFLGGRTRIGHTNPDDVVFSEGSFDATLHNPDGLFSPENSLSPLFGKLSSNIRVLVEIKRPSTNLYEMVWAGWTEDFAPVLSRGTLAQTRMKALQGRFYLEDLPLVFPQTEDITSDEAIKTVLNSGYLAPLDRLTALVDYSKVDTTAFANDSEDAYDLNTGDSTFSFLGDTWVRGKTTPLQAIKDIMEVERGWLWLLRDGTVRFRQRNYYAENPAVDHTLDIDTQATKGEYSYGKRLRNFAKITFSPRRLEENETVWSSTRIEVPGGTVQEVVVTPEETEGSKLAISSINGFQASSNPSSVAATTKGGADRSRYASAAFTLTNGELKLFLTNTHRNAIFFSISLVGTAIRTYGGETVEVGDDDSIDSYKLKAHATINTPLITDRLEATRLGQYLMYLYATPYGAYDELTIEQNAFDSTFLERMLDITLGDHLSVSDTKTGVDNRDMIVVGEEFEFLTGHLRTTYVLTKLPSPTPWILGTSKLDTEAYLGY